MSSAAEFEQYFVEGDTQHDSVNEARPTQTLVKNMFISPFWQFVIGATVLNGAYLLGVFGFSLLWLLLGSFLWVACEAYIHNKELYQTVCTDEKSAVLARLEDLPTWVFFPDTERVEWINKIVHQLWPYIGNLVEDLFRDDVEPAIQASLPAYLQSFKFDKLILGDMPPRVGGVKIYNENVARDEIVLDVEMMYSGDCLFSVKMTGLKAGIKDVQFHGTMRIEIKPLLKQLPLVGGIKLFFLTPPTIDFNLTSLANIFDIPGLSDILRTVIVDQLSTVMVLPNKINISLTESVNLRLLKFLQPVGVLQIEVLEAKQLQKSDFGFGSSDPYAIVTIGDEEFKTAIITDNINPVWNYKCEAIVNQVQEMTLGVEVMDKDKTSKDDFLGRVSLKVSSVIKNGRVNDWYPLEEAKSGQIHLKLAWLTLSDQKVLQHFVSPFSTSVLLVFVDSAKNLPDATKAAGEPSPQVQLKIANHLRYTSVRPKTNHPVWEENFSFLLRNPRTDELKLEVIDTRSTKCLGKCFCGISQLFKEKDLLLDQPFILQCSGPGAKIILMLKLKILKYKVPAHTSRRGKKSLKGAKIKKEITKISDICQTSRGSNINAGVEDSKRSSDEEGSSTQQRIQLTLKYILQQQQFSVVVNKVTGVTSQDDIFVKILLVSDSPKHHKQKTQAIKSKDNVAVFNKMLKFDLASRTPSQFKMKVLLKTKTSTCHFSSGKVLGRQLIDLSLIDFKETITDWFNLEPEETR